jgi:NADH:ubiquinone oxidoreductase subunit K
MSPDLFWVFTGVFTLLLLMGLYGMLVTFNLLRILIGLEIVMKGVTLFVIAAGHLSGQPALAQSMVITVIIVEVVVMIVAAGIVVSFQRANDSLHVRSAKQMRG